MKSHEISHKLHVPRHAGRLRLLLTAVVAQAMLTGTAWGQVVLDFELGSNLAQVSTQYSGTGVTFEPGVPLRTYAPGFAHSGTQAIELCFAAEFCKARLIAKFTTGQSSIKLFAGTSYGPSTGVPVEMVALDGNGAVIGTAAATLGPSPAPVPISVPLEVTSSSPNIMEIRFGSVSAEAYNNGLVVDDLTISAAGPQPQCLATVNPAVTLVDPAPGTTVQINEVRLRGSISTPGAPLESAILAIAGPNNQQSSSDLLGSIIQPSGGAFGPTNLSGSLFVGLNTLTLTIRNCRGIDQRSTTVTYGPAAPGTEVRLLGMEMTQATQDILNTVPLTAGKPTLLRLYFATTGGPDLQFVRGDVAGYKEGGNTPFLAQSVGYTTITSSIDLASKRAALTGSMNFLLSPDFYSPGKLNFFVLRLYVDGPGGATLSCIGCKNWSADFPELPRLNLVVQPYYYMPSMKTADTGASLMNALRYLNNVYPLRGDFPLDDSGLRLTLLLSMNNLELNTTSDTNRSRILYRLQNILDDLKSDPTNGVPEDAYILGIGPSGSPGGFANRNSKVAYGDSRALEDTPQAYDPEYYGAIWAQEIGHALGLIHVSADHGEMPPTDTSFPYPHGGIGEPGAAIGTEGWNGTPFIIPLGVPSAHAHDFMSYGSTSGVHTYSWVSPVTYKNVRNSVLATLPPAASAPALAPATEKLVVGGTMDASGQVTLAPSRIVKTDYTKGSGQSGGLKITLVSGSGETLGTYRFDAQPVIPGYGYVFNEFVPWVPGTRSIVLSRGNTVLVRRAVSAAQPTVTRVRAQAAGAHRLRVDWAASDADGDPLSYSIYFNSGLDERWIPVAFELTGQSATIDTTLLPASKRARVRVRASDGVNSGEAEGPVRLGRNLPIPAILSPTSGRTASAEVRLEGAVYDPQTGLLSGDRLHWRSDRDGDLGRGKIIHRRLSSGRHVITLTAANDAGASVTTGKEVTVP